MKKKELKIAFIGHSYHQKTKSNQFILDLLKEYAREIDFFYDDLWQGGPGINYDAVIKGNYDKIIVWQVGGVIHKLLNHIAEEKFIFFPMYDASYTLGKGFWKKLGNVKILSFSSTLYTKLLRFKCNVYYIKYFPNPIHYSQVKYSNKINVFYWQRRINPSIEDIINLFPECSIHWHRSFDPGQESEVTIKEDYNQIENLTTSEWFEKKCDLETLVDNMNVYIAPRDYEGIGMSFLEAMARGQCVFALDNPTMSEYIINGIDGVLVEDFSLASHKLNSSSLNKIGDNARKTIENGYEQWKDEYNYRLPSLIFELNDDFKNRSNFFFRNAKMEYKKTSSALITVAIVCFNAEKTIEKTLESIIKQDFDNYEIVVIDGKSQDKTLDIIEKYNKFISKFISEKDNGPYDAMNKAAQVGEGEWIIYINAGDIFYTPSSLKFLEQQISYEVDFVIGNHIYSNEGIEHFHKVNDFEFTWSSLISGNLTNKWKQGIPCHQATLTRRELISKYKYDISYKIAADHDFMYRMKKNGSYFNVINEYISIYYGGGLSSNNYIRCIDEWISIAKKYAPSKAVESFYFPKKNSLKESFFIKLLKNIIKGK